jgi:ComEC/Rec2-related protein
MAVIFISCIFFGLFSPLHLLSSLAVYCEILQKNCAEIFPETLSAAFVCGSEIADLDAEFLFRQSGLVHLMVVSGGHLQIIENFFALFVPPTWLKNRVGTLFLFFFFLSYTLLTGFQAPVVRAFFLITGRFANHYWRWNWSPFQIQTLTGIWVLILEPKWIFNFSFYLSWLASLGLVLAPWCFRNFRKTKFKHNILYFWFSTFCVQALISFAFHNFSILALLMNAFFAPILGLLLLPLSLLTLLWQKFSIFWSWLLAGLDWTLHTFGSSSVGEFPQTASRWIGLWFFMAFLHGLFWACQRLRYRKSYL